MRLERPGPLCGRVAQHTTWRRVGAGTASWASTTKEIARAGPSTGAVLTMLSRPSIAGARHASHLSGYTRLVAAAGPDCAATVLARLAGSLHQPILIESRLTAQQ